MRWLLLLALTLVTMASPARSQVREPRVTVALATPLVRLGGTVSLNLTVEGTDEAQVLGPFPAVEGLQFGPLRGPSVNRAYTMVGGRATRSVTVEWSVSVRPTRVGEFEIPPLQLVVAGRKVAAPSEPMSLRVIEDAQGAERGFFEIEAPARVFEGQPFTIQARFGFDQELPVRRHGLYLPWWGALRGVIELEPTVLDRGRDRIVVNDRQETDVEPVPPFERGGSVMRGFELRNRYLASRPGTMDLSASTYKYGVIVERGSGFRPDRYKDSFVQCEPVRVEVLPVPEETRPLEWSGAVGALEVTRRVDRRDLQEGDTLQLTVSWSGDANLAFFDPPDLSRLEAFSGFRVVGTTDEAFADERRVRYDLLAADSEMLEVPPVPLWTFDPGTERYILVETRPIPIRVRAVAETIIGFGGTESPPEDDLADLQTIPRSGEPQPLVGAVALTWTGLGLPLGWLLLRTFIRRRSGDPDGPRARRRRAAKRTLRRELGAADTASAQAAAFARFLAARTVEPEAAWVGRDLEAWSEGRGDLSAQFLADLVSLERELAERAWASADQPIDTARVLAVADQVLAEGLS